MFEPVTMTSTLVATGWLAPCGMGVIPCPNAPAQRPPALAASNSMILLTFLITARLGKNQHLSRQWLQEIPAAADNLAGHGAMAAKQAPHSEKAQASPR